MSEKTKTPSDSLAVRFDTLRTGVRQNLMDFLGKSLYNVLEGGELKTDIPFDIKGKFDLYDSSFNLTRNLGKDYKFDFDYNKRNPIGVRDDYRITLKKEF